MIRATILGCGSSGGVPRIGGRWGDCDPANPRNRRRRCSLLVARHGVDGVTQVLIDTGPDMVPQLLDADVGVLDGVVYTHPHADHVHGIDDLRQLVHNIKRRIPVWADTPTSAALLDRFAYIFTSPPGSGYPPVADLNPLAGPVTIVGAGGPLTLHPFRVRHGEISALGFRIGDLVYLPDVSDIPETGWPLIMGAKTVILDALRHTPHPSHAHLALSLSWLERAQCRHGVLTNMHIDMDYDDVMSTTPAHVIPAHDGLTLDIGETTEALPIDPTV